METDDQSRPAEHDETPAAKARPVSSTSWREGVLTRATELEALTHYWVAAGGDRDRDKALAQAVTGQLDEARTAATAKKRWRWLSGDGPLVERALSNLDAAEALLLNLAPSEYLIGAMPSFRDKVRRDLSPDNTSRQEFERIAGADTAELPEQKRGQIIATMTAANTARSRHRVSVDDFRNVVVATTLVTTALAAGIAVIGFFSPTTIPLCSQPEKSGQTLVVCPTGQSILVPAAPQAGSVPPDVDKTIGKTVRPEDLFIIEIIGLAAASLSAGNAIRALRSSPDPWGLSVALAALKLPTGALTAFLGVLLIQGQFVPGLAALDTPDQILAWAAVFGYAQRLFTRYIDQQAQNLLGPAPDASKRN